MSYPPYKQKVRQHRLLMWLFVYACVCVYSHVCGYTHVYMCVLSLKSNSRVSSSVTLSSLHTLSVSGTEPRACLTIEFALGIFCFYLLNPRVEGTPHLPGFSVGAGVKNFSVSLAQQVLLSVEPSPQSFSILNCFQFYILNIYPFQICYLKCFPQFMICILILFSVTFEDLIESKLLITFN